MEVILHVFYMFLVFLQVLNVYKIKFFFVSFFCRLHVFGHFTTLISENILVDVAIYNINELIH